jgi:hypothetical protein
MMQHGDRATMLAKVWQSRYASRAKRPHLSQGHNMAKRLRASSAGLAIVIALAPLVIPKPAQSQATTDWTPPRTPDGQPDLQGVWLSKTATPLERPKALEGRALLTDQEVAELTARADRLFREGNSDFAAGDAVFLAALSNPDRFKSPTSTHGS